jgi:hypothetical protein
MNAIVAHGGQATLLPFITRTEYETFMVGKGKVAPVLN